jgi:hypothetical protein
MREISRSVSIINRPDEPIAGLALAAPPPTRPKPSSVTIPASAAADPDFTAPLIDSRLVFLEHADALRILIESGELSVDDAVDRLMPAILQIADCRCYREILESFGERPRYICGHHHRDHRRDNHDHEDAADHGPADCGDGWLRGLVRAVATASEGDRNSILLWAACRGSEAVRNDKAAEGFVIGVLLEAAKRCGLGELEAKRTIQSGMRRT